MKRTDTRGSRRPRCSAHEPSMVNQPGPTASTSSQSMEDIGALKHLFRDCTTAFSCAWAPELYQCSVAIIFNICMFGALAARTGPGDTTPDSIMFLFVDETLDPAPSSNRQSKSCLYKPVQARERSRLGS